MSENLPHRQTVTAPPMQATEWEGELPSRLRAAFPSLDLAFRSYLGQNFIEATLAGTPDVLAYLKEREQFDMLTDLTAVDHPNHEQRFEIVYILYSFSKNEHLRVRTRVDIEGDVPTAVSLYPAADWMEREVFDMFGVHFAGHPHLKRILMPDEWHGFPLRKDMSITGMDNDWVRQNLGIESGQ